MAIPAGFRLGPYEVIASIGAGGMGEVYRARDTRLDRIVAIKVVTEASAADPEFRRRMHREAQAVSRLDHPHVCLLHDVGEQDDRMYLVMQFLDGETLAARLMRGPLPLIEALTIASQIASALEAAHDAGVAHRDLKPANVMLTKSGAKLLDFGLARSTGERAALDGTEIETQPGQILGTPAYLSPEQARGEHVDHRTDFFAFGMMLCEMVCGIRPFAGRTWPDMLAALLRDPAPDVRPALTTAPPSLADKLQTVLERCLAKRPSDRHESAGRLRQEIDALRGLLASGRVGVEAETKRAIAVLPFDDLSPAKDSDYFSDGLTDEIITSLSKLKGVSVICRASAANVKGAAMTTKEIARKLGVQYVMHGGVRRAGTDLRITAQLADESETLIWADRYAGTLNDIFQIQEKVARSIADALQLQLGIAERQSLAVRSMDDVRAFECYLKAMHEGQTFSLASFHRAMEYLQHGLSLVGPHPLLLAGLAKAHLNALEIGLERFDEAVPPARDIANKLLAAQSAEAHAVLGKLERAAGSQLRAIGHFERALAHNPADIDSYYWLILDYANHAGQPAAARAALNHLMRIDPLTVSNRLGLGWVLMSEGDPASALGVFESMWRDQPELRFARFMCLFPLIWLGRTREAVDLATSFSRNSADMFAVAATAVRSALTNDAVTLCASIEGEYREYFWNDPEFPWWFSGWFAAVNDRDRAPPASARCRSWLVQPSGDGWWRPVLATAAWRRALPRIARRGARDLDVVCTDPVMFASANWPYKQKARGLLRKCGRA